MNNANKKKWLSLCAIGGILLLIPRRSSKKADRKLSETARETDNKKVTDKVINRANIKDKSALK